MQVTDETCAILQHFGYIFEQRGLVSVKGKGQLMTYYLIGKGSTGTGAVPTYSTMETVKEEEEEEAETDELSAGDQQALLTSQLTATITPADTSHH